MHRDIKPANLMLLADGTVKICDFGIARIQDVTAGLTADGARLGTPVYMAPEQFDGQKADHRSDLYALGASLYQLFTGRFVFPADDLRALVGMHLAKAPDPPSTYRLAIPPALDALIISLLAKDPTQRPVSASETASRLRAALTRSRALLAEAERIARSITGPIRQAEALREVAKAVAGHDPAQAERIARSIRDPTHQAWALSEIAMAIVGVDPVRAGELLAQAERIARTNRRTKAERSARSITDPAHQARALQEVAKAVAGS